LQATGITALASARLGLPAFPVDAIFLDKSVEANWTVPAHQDRVLPVASDCEGKHRIRDGIPYAEPDAQTLSRLLALRIHFDSTDATSGALCFVPGSHRDGVLSDAAVSHVSLSSFIPCTAHAGDVILMRPLTLHRSSPSQGQGHRRVLHVVYAAYPPTLGLKWRTGIG
jgi:ectoine hydroxylase-related dioxygenase (phytanoyl-CoA dioxygenase family)